MLDNAAAGKTIPFMLRAEPASDEPLLNNRVTDAITRHRKLLFVLIGLLFIAGFNGRWRLGLDSANYRGLALSIASGRGYVFGEWATHQAYPGMPYVLGAIEYVLGPRDRTPSLQEQNRLIGPSAATSGSVLFVVLCAVATLVVTYRLIKLHYPKWVAVTVTCGVGSNAIFLQYANELMTDVPFLLGVVLALYGWDLIKRAADRRSRSIAIAVLLCGALLAGTMRPMFWVLLVSWVTFCAWELVRSRNKFYAIALFGVVVVGGVLLMMVPRGYETEAVGWLRVGISRLPKSVHALLNDQLPAAMFGEQLSLFSIGRISPTSVLGSLLVLGSPLLFLRKHLLWALMVWCTLVVTLFLTQEPRYYMMVLPILLLGWLYVVCWIARRLPKPWSEVALVCGLALVTLNNLSKSTHFFVDQHRPLSTSLKYYKNGEYLGLLEMCETIRQNVPMDKKILGPSGSIMSVMSGRHVVSQREIIRRGGDRNTPQLMKKAGIDYIILPAKLYRNKERVIYNLISRHVIGARSPIIARTSSMQLARMRVRVPPARVDWRKVPPRKKPKRVTTGPARLRATTRARTMTSSTLNPGLQPLRAMTTMLSPVLLEASAAE